ncbi:MAG: MBL fold metallo-hydrolase [Pseudobutyrivibrio sp.]|nr:MBL fold metallo-hydrolase [Pseudobutyrivibrio sp.]
MAWLKFIVSITRTYWDDMGYAILFLLGLLGILIFEKEKIKRYIFLWYTGIVLVFIYNPITYAVMKYSFSTDAFDQYYMRFFSIIMVPVIIAYGFTLLIKNLKGVKKLAGTLAVIALIAIFGRCVYTQDWYTKAENRNKVPQDVVTICDIFADYEGDTIRIMAPQDIAVYLRQMDSRFSMPYARELPDEAYELTNESPNPQVVADYCLTNDVDYVVVSAAENVLDTYIDAGFELYGRTTYYAVLTPYQGDWILTEYTDLSELQGICYTMYNKNDGTLLVVDGGHVENEQMLRDAINAYGGHVDAWFLTHYHMDHIDAFNEIYNDPQGIEIENVYVTPLDAETFYPIAQEWDDVDSFDRFMEVTEGATNINYVQRDDVLEFSDDLTITFFNAMDDVVKDCAEDIPNNCSLVFKMATKNRSILFCGDCHSKYMADYLVETYGEKLSADILQCGHHGNNSMPTDSGFYEMVSPSISIFDLPDNMLTSPNFTAGALAAYLQDAGSRIVWFKSAPNVFAF